MGAEPRLVGTHHPWSWGKPAVGTKLSDIERCIRLYHHHVQFQDRLHVFKEVAVALWNLVNFTWSVANQIREDKSAKGDVVTAISEVILHIIFL